MDIPEKINMANYCLSCPTKPCRIGCPLGNDITGFIKEIKNQNFNKAFEILSETTVLIPICGRVCPQKEQCEGKCIRGIKGESVRIGELEAWVGDMALKEGWRAYIPKTTKFNVAVIGGGPAGLTCAYFLRKNGIGVTIYEKYNYLGGLLVHGIPEFRLPRNIVNQVTDNIVHMGIDVKYNMELGKIITLEELKNKYDAIFIGIGANNSNKMNIPGEELNGVYGGNELLEHNIELNYNDKTVIISGGGNVAIDVARTVKRSGAKNAIIVYRRSEKEMPASIKEVEDAKQDGVEFIFQSNLLGIYGNENVERIELVKTELVYDESGTRPKPVNIPDSNYIIECDYVIMAIGSHPDEIIDSFKLEKDRGKILTDEKGRTSDSKIFAGGDISNTRNTVASAAHAGRNAAYGIMEYLEK